MTSTHLATLSGVRPAPVLSSNAATSSHSTSSCCRSSSCRGREVEEFNNHAVIPLRFYFLYWDILFLFLSLILNLPIQSSLWRRSRWRPHSCNDPQLWGWHWGWWSPETLYSEVVSLLFAEPYSLFFLCIAGCLSWRVGVQTTTESLSKKLPAGLKCTCTEPCRFLMR